MATKANLIIDQGSSFSTTIDIADENDLPIDLTGYTGAGQIRKTFTSLTAVSFAVVIAGPAGAITLSLTSTQTSAITAGRYVFDVELTSSAGTVSRIVEGIATVTPQVTR